MKFSVIMPIYNSESFLDKSVGSVLAQSFHDFELILVNDGSTDNSGAIIDEYSHADSRVKVVHKENAGQLWARRDGISQAEGTHILFIDSDDQWREDCLETLAAIIEKNDPDIIMFRAIKDYEDSCKKIVLGGAFPNEQWLDKKHIYETLISDVAYNALWSKVFRHELFLDDSTDYSKFKGVCWGEDKAQLLFPLTKAKNVFYTPEELYYYRYNPGSVINKVDLAKIPGMISNHVYELLYKYMREWDMSSPKYIEAVAVSYLRNFLSVYYRLRRNGNKTEQKKFRSINWDEFICKDAFCYASSKSLSGKEKLKLFVARYIRFI